MITLFSEPTTANGMVFYQTKDSINKQRMITRQTHPNTFVEVNLLFIVLVCVIRIRKNVIENQLFPDLQEEKN